jgi:hypothetical protein
MIKNMLDLFIRCLKAKYTHTACDGDYAVQIQGDTLYLLFEWSDGAEDWKNNFNFPVKPYKNMKPQWYCHRGFLKVWKAMRDDVEFTVNRLLGISPQVKNIKCVGYSHGAAIAVLATEDMVYLYGDKYTVSGYGFGAPRVLWGVVPKEVRERLKCFTTIRNIPDIVTHVPPILFGFHNAGTLLRIGEKGKYTPIKAHYDSAYIEELKGGDFNC